MSSLNSFQCYCWKCAAWLPWKGRIIYQHKTNSLEQVNGCRCFLNVSESQLFNYWSLYLTVQLDKQKRCVEDTKPSLILDGYKELGLIHSHTNTPSNPIMFQAFGFHGHKMAMWSCVMGWLDYTFKNGTKSLLHLTGLWYRNGLVKPNVPTHPLWLTNSYERTN